MKHALIGIGLCCAVTLLPMSGMSDEASLRYEQDANYLVRPGLLANRAERWVRVDAQATGISDSSPVEFFAVYKKSGHDYEALFISEADPLDIHQALEFIGCTAGQPIAYSQLRFWPKGERIMVRVEWEVTEPDGTLRTPSLPLEELIYDSRRKGPLPTSGFVFTGSQWVMIESNERTQRVYAASAGDPYAIISDYNEASSVLDVPFQRPDSEVYGTQTAFGDHLFQKGQPVRLVFRPEPRTEARVQNLSLLVSPKEPDAGIDLEILRFDLRNTAGEALAKEGELKHFLSALRMLQKKDQDPFISLSFSDNLTLGQAKITAELLNEISGDRGIRMDPPPDGQLFYKAFLPDESLRKRHRRPSQPLEMHLSRSEAGGIEATLIRLEERWTEGAETPELIEHAQPLQSAAQVSQVLSERLPYQRALLILAPSSTTIGELWPLISEVAQTRATIHIYLDEAKAPE